ncbi:MAG: HD domain-containing phosphohydrolase [bacterium]
MSEKRHALYVLAPGEPAPPVRLQECAVVTPMAAEDLPDSFFPTEKIDFLALKLPMHPVIRERIDRLHRDQALPKLPVLGVGAPAEDGVNACITEEIPADDLSTILELLCDLNRCEILMQEEKRELAHSQKELEQIVNDLVEVISLLLDLRIPEASRRGRRVAEAAEYMGNQLGLEPKALRELSWAAKLRELGKAGLPDSILSKPRSMRSESEQNLYERYPVWGGIALGGMPGLKDTAAVIHHQLEDFDGTGYPKGLTGADIPIGSRILRVAAAFEIIATDLDGSPEIAMEILERGANREFDPLLVKLMAGYLKIAQTPDWDLRIMRMPLAALHEGQTLAEDLWTRSGVKLLPQGAKLTAHTIQLLLKYRATDPMADSVAIYRPGKEEA